MTNLKSLTSAYAICIALLVISCNKQAVDNGPICINQVGFTPDQEMTATIVLGNDPSSFSNHQYPMSNCYITNIAGDTVWTGVTSEVMYNPVSGKPCQVVDFSALDTPGTYTLYVENDQLPISNVQFTIRQHPYKELTRKALRAFYYQRASMPIVEPYAEGFARPAGHPDDHVIVHASAATEDRPEGTIISSPGGWYDAGDYNKYIVNSGYTMGVWLMAYELNKEYYDTLKLNIPESGSTMPDMLSEAMYNLRWMLTMQDLDGGVYHKLTEPDFEGFIRPDQCTKPRYVVLKTTAATLDFAATMAMAARVYAPFDSAFTQQATEAAKRAYVWALEHPAVYYNQDAMNAQFKPEITTGAYDDNELRDEFYWAKTELYLLTKEEMYYEDRHPTFVYKPAAWGNVAELADIEWMMHPDEGGRFSIVREAEMLAYLKHDLADAETISVFRSPYGNTESDFYWGCNSEGCCWRGIECLYAYRLTGDRKYLVNAERCLNYILGQNATGYCYVTGFGTHPSSHPHHRPKNIPADESYLDEQPSYASNEVTINWNVTLFALSAGIDALQ